MTPPEEPATQPVILVGPLLRRGADNNGVSVWVETSQACTVTVLGKSTPTFCVADHHYALVDIGNLPRGELIGYEVELDGAVAWPNPALGLSDSRFELWSEGDEFRVSGGSCRQQAPQNLKRRRSKRLRKKSDVTDELGADALATLAAEVLRGSRPVPHLLLLTGDQVYADEQHQSVTSAMQQRRGGPPAPGEPEVTSYEEYTWLYQRTWSHPLIRWILSCVPSLMIFDDHDVIDDWNISDSWAVDIAQESWWVDRLDAALMAYWVYQHLGNLSPEQRRADPLYQRVSSMSDGSEPLRSFAAAVGTGTDLRLEYSWSYQVQAGPVNVIVLDARNGRVLQPDSRSMLSPTDWQFFDDNAEHSEHLLVVSSVPWLLPPGVQHLERLVSAVADGRWGPRSRRVGEWVRREIDMEHWAAFGSSSKDLTDRFSALVARSLDAASTRDRPVRPLVFSGDVHFAYLAEHLIGNGRVARQVVSSPLRQGDATYEHAARWAAFTSIFEAAMRKLVRLVTGTRHRSNYSITSGIWTDNNIASFSYNDDAVTVNIDRAELTDRGLFLRPLVQRTFVD